MIGFASDLYRKIPETDKKKSHFLAFGFCLFALQALTS